MVNWLTFDELDRVADGLQGHNGENCWLQVARVADPVVVRWVDGSVSRVENRSVELTCEVCDVTVATFARARKVEVRA